MPRETMRTFFVKQSPSTSPLPSPPHRHTFAESLIDENLETAQLLISKWDTSSSDYLHITSLFSAHNRPEAEHYLNSIKQLQSMMQFYVSENSTSEKLVRAQRLIQRAMKRLEKEFYQILKSNWFCRILAELNVTVWIHEVDGFSWELQC